MTYRLPPLPALRAFEAAARHLSFKKAAEELHVTPAAISQQIKQLEGYLNVVLFRRLTRALELTERGEAMLPKIREGFACLASAIETTRSPALRSLTVAAPPSFASRWLVPRLQRFAALHPDVELRLSSSADSVDRPGATTVFEAGPVDVRDETSEIAIRYGTGSYPGYRVEQVFAPAYVPVCSPALATPKRPLNVPADLAHHVLIHDETIESETNSPSWQAWLKLARVPGVDSQRGPRFSNTILAIEAALEGQGVALAPQPLVEADLAAGRLVVPFDQPLPSPFAYYLVMPEVVAGRAPVAAFRDWLLHEAESQNNAR